MLQPTPRAHVLVINDAQAMIDGLPDLLAREGYRVSHSMTHLDCLRIRDLMPDVIVQDLVVAGRRETCWHFLSLVRQEEDLMHIPLILCPAASEMICNPAMGLNLQHLGVRVLRRPFVFDDMRRSVEEVLAV
jgi:CheY-like chemotaxis protein